MPTLIALKNRKKVIQNILRISTAMKAAASVKMRKAQIHIEEFQPFSELTNASAASIMESLFLPFIMKKDAKNTLNILIGCDNGLCGDFFNKLKTYFSHQIRFSKEENQIWMLIGSKFENLCNNDKHIFAGSASLDSAKIYSIAARLYAFIAEKDVATLIVHYFHETEIKQMVIFSKETLFHAFSENYQSECDNSTTGTSFCNLDLNIISTDYAIFFLSSKLYQILLKSMYEENKQRIYAMSQAKTNAESMEKLVNRLYNRARQEKITLALNEITTGV